MKHSFENIPLTLLRERAFNMRWAQQPEGVIPLTAADPDFPACPAVRDAIARYANEGVFSYSATEGMPLFREAVAKWFRDTRRIGCTSEAVLATDSAARALAIVAVASLKHGDEVLIPDPVDFLFRHAIERAGAKAIGVRIDANTSSGEYVTALAAHLTPRTRMLWICNPHNPLGVVYTREWLSAVANWAVESKLEILSDEVWSDIVFSPHCHVSVASLSPEIASKTVTVYGFSKNFALAGLRVGCIVCTNPAWRKQIVAASDFSSTVSGVSVLSQIAVNAALEEGLDWLSDFVSHLQLQRDYVTERISTWPGVVTYVPQGTYVIFPCIKTLSEDSQSYCEYLRDKARVALVPGATQWFGPNASGHLRLSFATSHNTLKEAFDRLEPIVNGEVVRRI